MYGLFIDWEPEAWSQRDQKPVGKGVHCPDIRGPICVTEASREWKESRLYLLQLAHDRERAEGNTTNPNNAGA
jgi:hypothetical protein